MRQHGGGQPARLRARPWLDPSRMRAATEAAGSLHYSRARAAARKPPIPPTTRAAGRHRQPRGQRARTAASGGARIKMAGKLLCEGSGWCLWLWPAGGGYPLLFRLAPLRGPQALPLARISHFTIRSHPLSPISFPVPSSSFPYADPFISVFSLLSRPRPG